MNAPIPAMVVQNDTQSFRPFASLNTSEYRKFRLREIERHPYCRYCGREVNDVNSSLDHVVPRCRGGRDWPSNLVLCCSSCNVTKDDMTLQEWRDSLLEQVQKLQAMADKVTELAESGQFSRLKAKPRTPKQTQQSVQKRGGPMRRITPTDPPRIDSLSGEQIWTVDNFKCSRRLYRIIDKASGAVILRNLPISAAVHYLKAVGGEGFELEMQVRMYRDDLGLPVPENAAENADF